MNRIAGAPGPGRERGSALLVTLVVAAVLTLLGLTFLMMAQAENRIADNEKLAAQALYAAESGVQAVRAWFDDPAAGAVRTPSPAAVDRSRRLVDDDGPGPRVAVAAAVAGLSLYKAGIDLDGDSVDDLFRRPYRGGPAHTLLGTVSGPDVVLDADGSSSARAYLDALSRDLFSDYPAAGSGMVARISRVDLYAPPYLQSSGSWVRYGMGTARVTARIERHGRAVAERTVAAVLNEAPYAGPWAALHSCEGLVLRQPLTVHWGAATASCQSGDPACVTELSTVTTGLGDIPASLPRSLVGQPADPGIWGAGWPAPLDDFSAVVEEQIVTDPWFRLLSAGSIPGAPAGRQPFPSAWESWVAPSPPPAAASDHSGLFQDVPAVPCPRFDYEVWRMVASSGGSGARYFVWAGADTFREDGRGPARSFVEITRGQEGMFFFETTDRQPPVGTTNLTPALTITDPGWSFRGVLYLNAVSIRTDGVIGAATTFRAPGEPWSDLDGNGRFDVVEPWINLRYPATLAAGFPVDADDTMRDPGAAGAGAMRNARGPALGGAAGLQGILYTSGSFDARGAATHYGSIIARLGVTQNGAVTTTPDLYWDESIAGEWPPPGWNLPRVVITSWITDL